MTLKIFGWIGVVVCFGAMHWIVGELIDVGGIYRTVGKILLFLTGWLWYPIGNYMVSISKGKSVKN